MSQEKLQTMSMQNFGGIKEVHYGIVQVVNGAGSNYFSRNSVLADLLWARREFFINDRMWRKD